MKHRNSQKRYYNENYIYFIVTKTYQNFPYFMEKMFCELFIEELRICKKSKQFKLYAFCLVYDHLNLLVQTNKKYNISKIMQFLKRHFSRSANYVLNNPEGAIGQSRLRGRKYQHFANIIEHHEQETNMIIHKFKNKIGNKITTIPPFKWQKSFHDHIIRSRRDFEKHYNYTIYNYSKHGLPDDWQYTSLNYEEMVDELTDDKPFEWRPFIKNNY